MSSAETGIEPHTETEPELVAIEIGTRTGSDVMEMENSNTNSATSGDDEFSISSDVVPTFSKLHVDSENSANYIQSEKAVMEEKAITEEPIPNQNPTPPLSENHIRSLSDTTNSTTPSKINHKPNGTHTRANSKSDISMSTLSYLENMEDLWEAEDLLKSHKLLTDTHQYSIYSSTISSIPCAESKIRSSTLSVPVSFSGISLISLLLSLQVPLEKAVILSQRLLDHDIIVRIDPWNRTRLYNVNFECYTLYFSSSESQTLSNTNTNVISKSSNQNELSSKVRDQNADGPSVSDSVSKKSQPPVEFTDLCIYRFASDYFTKFVIDYSLPSIDTYLPLRASPHSIFTEVRLLGHYSAVTAWIILHKLEKKLFFFHSERSCRPYFEMSIKPCIFFTSAIVDLIETDRDLMTLDVAGLQTRAYTRTRNSPPAQLQSSSISVGWPISSYDLKTVSRRNGTYLVLLTPIRNLLLCMPSVTIRGQWTRALHEMGCGLLPNFHHPRIVTPFEVLTLSYSNMLLRTQDDPKESVFSDEADDDGSLSMTAFLAEAKDLKKRSNSSTKKIRRTRSLLISPTDNGSLLPSSPSSRGRVISPFVRITSESSLARRLKQAEQALQSLQAMNIWLGFAYDAMGENGNTLFGLRVRNVEENSPAQFASIYSRDLIVEVNGIRTITMAEFKRALTGLVPGTTVPLVIERQDKVLQKSIVIGSQGATMDEINTLYRLVDASSVEIDQLSQVGSLSLSDVISVPQFRYALHRYMQANYCAESLGFLLAEQAYQQLRSHEVVLAEHYANLIYSYYVDVSSPHMVNIDSSQRKSIRLMLHQQCYTPMIFHHAARTLYQMCEDDVFRRFLQSPEYAIMTSTSAEHEDNSLRRGRRRKNSFSCIPLEEDQDEMNSILNAVLASGIVKEQRRMLKVYKQAFTGSVLLNFILENYAKHRHMALAVCQRLLDNSQIFAAALSNAALSQQFSEADFVPDDSIYTILNPYEGPSAPDWLNLASSEITYSYVLLRGVNYARVFVVISRVRKRMFFYRNSKAANPICICKLKGAQVSFVSSTIFSTHSTPLPSAPPSPGPSRHRSLGSNNNLDDSPETDYSSKIISFQLPSIMEQPSTFDLNLGGMLSPSVSFSKSPISNLPSTSSCTPLRFTFGVCYVGVETKTKRCRRTPLFFRFESEAEGRAFFNSVRWGVAKDEKELEDVLL